MAGGVISPVVPLLTEVWADNRNIILLSKLVVTLPALFIALFATWVGSLTDRGNPKKILKISLVLYAVAGAAAALSTNVYLLLGTRALLGIATAGTMTSTLTLLGRHIKGREREQFIGTQSAVMAGGGALMTAAAGILADIGWRMPFLVYLLALPVLLLTQKYCPNGNGEKGSIEDAEEESYDTFLTYTLFFTVGIGMIIFYLVPTQSPFILKEVGASSAKLQSLALILVTVVSAIASRVYTLLKKHYTHKTIFILSFSIQAVGFLLVSMLGSYTPLLLAYTVVGCGVGLLMPNGYSWLLEAAPQKQQGRLSGVMTAFVFGGQFLSPLLFAPLGNSTGIQEGHYVVAGLAAAVATYYLIRYVILVTHKTVRS